MFSGIIVKRLIRQASDSNHPRRLDAIKMLGNRPMTTESIACLADIVRRYHDRPTGDALEAAKSLAKSGDPRISAVLASLISIDSNYQLKDYLVATLSHPKHEAAIPPILEAASRELNATGRCQWVQGVLEAIGTAEATSGWNSFRRASVKPILRTALGQMKSLSMVPENTEGDLQSIGTPEAFAALDTLRREMIGPLLRIVLDSDDYDGVKGAVEKLQSLKTLSVPGSSEALQRFLSLPARKLVKWQEFSEQDESGALKRWTDKREESSRDFGQR